MEIEVGTEERNNPENEGAIETEDIEIGGIELEIENDAEIDIESESDVDSAEDEPPGNFDDLQFWAFDQLEFEDEGWAIYLHDHSYAKPCMPLIFEKSAIFWLS
ncbi:Hypothetical protein NTJ_11932 [Nesidiocoris tenuis]|uniref:Uncharacterized protein n=1 Tax=Nesidiocoris tenuis TaxID=355587 RepID=A0ABN7B3V4_9HEMI|nr:Hypothetical protein NTJ_11932 [Nesidiocoris tenuis]